MRQPATVGPRGGFRLARPAAEMAAAHEAWRQTLAADTLADILASLPDDIPARTRTRMAETTRVQCP